MADELPDPNAVTPEEEAAWRAVSLKKAKQLEAKAVAAGWLASPLARWAIGVFLTALLGGVVVGRYSADPDPAPPVDVAKLVGDGFAKLDGTLSKIGTQLTAIDGKIDRQPGPAPTPPKPPEPSPPDPDDWGGDMLPAETQAQAGRMVKLKAKVKKCVWLVPPGSPCDSDAVGDSLYLTPSAARDFPIAVISLPDGAYCWTIVKASPPVPVPPPEPAPPTPTPPAPTPSALTLKLQAAYTADAALPAVKDTQRITLKGLYEAMADHANNPAIATTTDLLADLKTVSGQLVQPNALVEVRKVISAEIVSALGTTPGAKLDPDLRPRAVGVFTRIAKSLGEVK